jgi:hypothetical protein
MPWVTRNEGVEKELIEVGQSGNVVCKEAKRNRIPFTIDSPFK